MLGYVKTITFNGITAPLQLTAEVRNTMDTYHCSLVACFGRAKPVRPGCCILDDIGNHLSKALAIFFSKQVKQSISALPELKGT